MSLLSPNLTDQQEMFIKLLASGLAFAKAASLANYPSVEMAEAALQLPVVHNALLELKTGIEDEIRFTVQDAHVMYLQAMFSAANSTEQKNVVDSMVKLHGLDTKAPPSREPRMVYERQTRDVSDAQLLEVVGKDAKYLDPAGEQEEK